MWEEWRFEPWRGETAEGLYRRVSLIKGGLLGEIAKYYADDYIIWKYLPEDVERLRKEAKSERDLMLQRYIFLQDEGEPYYKKSSLALGFRGFVEIHKYTLGAEPRKDIKDMAYLANIAEEKTRDI
ncbi:MAG: hypothetical protein Q4F74_05970 [Synergistaceae bacterium]|nr:hypothetical protein [Synergistaceae bacterium]